MSRILNLNIRKQKLCYKSCDVVASGTQDYLYAKFSTDGEWSELTKTAIFYVKSDTVFNVVLDDDGKCLVPAEVLSGRNSFYVGLYGVKGIKRVTSTIIKIDVVQGAYIEGETPQPPTEDVWQQIITELDKKIEEAPKDGKQYARKDGDWAVVTGGAVNSVNGKTGDVELSKTDIGLGNVDNTSDINKPISTSVQTALDSKADSDDIPVVNDGITTLKNSEGTTIGTISANQSNNQDITLPGGGGGITPVQTTGQSTTDVMSQKATTDMVFNPTNGNVMIGRGTAASAAETLVVGKNSFATAEGAMAVGIANTANQTYATSVGCLARAQARYSVALGANSRSLRASEVAVGDGSTSTDYGTRFLANVRDPALAQDAATKAYVDAKISFASAPSADEATAQTASTNDTTKVYYTVEE